MCVKHRQKKKSNGSFKMRHFFFTNKISDKKVDRESGFYILHILCARLTAFDFCMSVNPWKAPLAFLSRSSPTNIPSTQSFTYNILSVSFVRLYAPNPFKKIIEGRLRKHAAPNSAVSKPIATSTYVLRGIEILIVGVNIS